MNITKLIGQNIRLKEDNSLHKVTAVNVFIEDTFNQGRFAVETDDGLYLYECEIEIMGE